MSERALYLQQLNGNEYRFSDTENDPSDEIPEELDIDDEDAEENENVEEVKELDPEKDILENSLFNENKDDE